jgi:hypothetical protein
MVEDKARAERIAKLNDLFRKHPERGRLVVTRNVNLLGPLFVQKAIQAVGQFSDFTKENDPHKERDFFAFEVDGTRLFWKCDYYDETLEGGSEDPADETKTIRVGTIMLPEDY